MTDANATEGNGNTKAANAPRSSGNHGAGIDARSLVTHLSELAEEASTLLKKELQLARVEVKEGMEHLKGGLMSVAASGAVLYAGALFALAGITLLLARAIPLWGASLLVGAALLVAGYLVYSRGKENVKPDELVPRRAIRTLKETPKMMEKPA